MTNRPGSRVPPSGAVSGAGLPDQEHAPDQERRPEATNGEVGAGPTRPLRRVVMAIGWPR